MPTNIATYNTSIPTMSEDSIQNARDMETYLLSLPQVLVTTAHTLHAGVYTRTVFIPKGVVISGALIKRSVNLIISGDTTVFIGDDKAKEYKGYASITAMPYRKQVFIANEDTYLTMFFATEATTIEEAENEFTDEVDNLISRHPSGINNITITGV